MNEAVELWSAFVMGAAADSDELEEGAANLRPDRLNADRAELERLAYRAFRIAGQCLLMGAEDIGKLALACERCLDYLRDGVVMPELGVAILASSTYTLRRAFESLAAASRPGVSSGSGPRIDSRPVEAARYELETLFPVPGAPKKTALAPDVPVTALTRKRTPPASPGDRDGGGHDHDHDHGRHGHAGHHAGAKSATIEAQAPEAPGRESAHGAGTSQAFAGPTAPAAHPAPAAPAQESALWVPIVDEDMVELFFEEAAERIEDLSLKLIEIEQRPDDAELVRGAFRDLHTLKGSSAMVGLGSMNTLAHAAEDLMGQVRDGVRRADTLVVDALLAALDGLRDVVALAKSKQPIQVDLGPVLAQLRDPSGVHLAMATARAQDLGEYDNEEGDERDDSGAGVAGNAAAPHAAGQGRGSAAREREARMAPGPDRGTDKTRGGEGGHATIRVDFDKLDHLMNLVGELVLGRDGLRSAVQSLSAVSSELSADRQLTRKLHDMRKTLGSGTKLQPDSLPGGMHTTLSQLSEELGRVERVLLDIFHDLDYAASRLDAVSGELRDQVLSLRMIPVRGIFRKHHRTVRDLAAALGKEVRLELVGEETELDKLVVEAIDEPLLHLVRNAIDHGIEPPEERIRRGKPAEGCLRLIATHRGSQVLIQLADDGRGIDPAAIRRRARERGVLSDEELRTMDDRDLVEVIFRPGFSTAAHVSQMSGRGVGMDVVKQTIIHRLKGTIETASTPGQGTTFTLRLPLTLAIIQVLMIRAGGELLAIPLDPVVRTLAYDAERVELVQDREVIAVRGRQVPLVRIDEVLELDSDASAGSSPLQIILVEVGAGRYGLGCSHLLGKREIVIKPLGDVLEVVPCAAGATLVGDRCVLILDVAALIDRAQSRAALGRGTSVTAERGGRRTAVSADAPHVLVVDDSETVRESLRRLFTEAGLRCTLAIDGVDGLRAATAERFDLVSTDVMMPRMDGYELTRALRAMPEYRDVPIVMVTTRGERIDRVRGFDAGVDEYITKPHDRQTLLRVVRKLIEAAGERSSSEGGEP